MDDRERRRVVLSDVSLHSWAQTRYWELAQDLPFHASVSTTYQGKFDDAVRFADRGGEKIIQAHLERGSCGCVLFRRGPCVALLEVRRMFRASLASGDVESLHALADELRETFPDHVERDDSKVAVTFWTLSPEGPVRRVRVVTAPTWKEVSGNYPESVGAELSRLTELREAKSGQLILFHGEPGTGKSYAIRALLQEWKPWCSAHYIVDPDKFFGQSAEYMLSVLLSGEDDDDVSVALRELRGQPKRKRETWTIYLVEDGDEFLTEDAKTRSGQALSRLLNVVDGFIGQGLNVLVLVTTNEPLDKLHPAVTRPGRCLANVHFRAFSKSEAQRWLRDHGAVAVEVKGPQTLARLYDGLGGGRQIAVGPLPRAIGFDV